MSPRILIHVQHLLGIGHLRRAALLARTLAARGAEVMCVSGGYPVADIDFGAARLHQLPAARAQDLSYKRLVDIHGELIDDVWRQRRCTELLAVVAHFRPDIIVTETFPFGRRLLRFELESLIEWVTTQPGVRLVASIRDILEGFASRSLRVEYAVATVRKHYGAVLVHADPDWVRLDATFAGTNEIIDKVHYTGYISDNNPVAAAKRVKGAGEVLVSTGGGAVAAELAQAAVSAARVDRSGVLWRVLLGPNFPDAEFQVLRSLAQSNLEVERNRADFPELLAHAAVSVSQGGYNTVAELLSTNTPAVIVPFVASGQSEQTRRAQLLAARGRVVVVMPAMLTSTSLGAAVARAAGLDVPQHGARLHGAHASADYLLQLVHAN